METHLSKRDLEAIEERFEKATAGPWCVAGSERDYVIAKHGDSERCSDNPVLWADEDCLHGRKEDAEFIAHARSDLPQLVDEIHHLRALMKNVLHWQFASPSWLGARRKYPNPALANEILSLFPEEDLPQRLHRLLTRSS